MIGVYYIVNIINGDKYVGSSVDLNKRYNQHKRLLRLNKHHSIKLQRATDKYGLENFVFVIIEICERNDLKMLEQKYIDNNPDYNISKSSHCPMLGRKHSEETKIKFKNRNYKKGKDNHLYGIPWSEEIRKKIIQKRTGQKRSEDFKNKQRVNAIKNNLARFIKDVSKVKVVDDLGNIYDSLKEAASVNNISVQTVCDILKGRHKRTRSGRSFKYYDEV